MCCESRTLSLSGSLLQGEIPFCLPEVGRNWNSDGSLGLDGVVLFRGEGLFHTCPVSYSPPVCLVRLLPSTSWVQNKQQLWVQLPNPRYTNSKAKQSRAALVSGKGLRGEETAAFSATTPQNGEGRYGHERERK